MCAWLSASSFICSVYCLWFNKILNNQAPSYLKVLTVPYHSSRPQTARLLVVPGKTSAATQLGGFTVRTGSLWNGCCGRGGALARTGRTNLASVSASFIAHFSDLWNYWVNMESDSSCFWSNMLGEVSARSAGSIRVVRVFCYGQLRWTQVGDHTTVNILQAIFKS